MDIILEKIPEVVKLIEFTSYIDNREFENETNDILHSIYRDELKLRFLTDLLNEVLTKKEEQPFLPETDIQANPLEAPAKKPTPNRVLLKTN